MGQRGRPPLDYTPIVIQIGDFHLHPIEDADLIALLRPVPRGQRVKAIKAALRSGGTRPPNADGLAAADDDLTTAAGDFL
jgi:hypothetical protein